MNKSISWFVRLVLAACLAIAMINVVLAQPNMDPMQNAAPAKPAAAKPLREIFVPFDDLQVILESDKNRVFLTREEYEELLKVVQAKAAQQGPVNVVMLTSAYTGKIDDGRAQITGKIELEVLQDGWQIVPLSLGYVGVKSAALDGKPAAIARDPRGNVRLFVNGLGKHQLELQLTAAVPAAAALQTLNIALPVSTAATLDLSVAGNVEVKGGASVVRRAYDEAANRTQLELLLARGTMSIVMSLNNKQAREQRLVVARTVQVDEITLGYERLHVNVSLRILHDPVDRFRFVVPAGFEVTSVSSQRLSRWEVKPDDKGRQILEAILSEATTESTLITISANRSPELGQDWLASLQKWKLPRLQPLDVAGEVAVVGLLVEDRLEPQEFATKQLLPIDSPILTQAMPESIFRAEPGAPIVRHVATYYVPAYIDATQYDLSANFVRPETGLVVSTSLLLSLSDQGHELRGGFIVSPLAEDLFQVRLKAPLGWRVQEVLGDNDQPLSLERYELADGSTRLIVTLPSRLEAGGRKRIIVRASSSPAGWLGDWKEQTVTFPTLEIEGASRENGAIAVQTIDDLAVQPQELSGLVPLLENEKQAQGLGGVTTTAAYRFESRPFAAKFVIERKQPSLVAEVFSFVQVLPDALKAHYELVYQVREARTRQLVFSLPATTPKEISIQGLDGVQVKEHRSSEDGDRRRWVVQLADRRSGELRLKVDFQQPLAEKQVKAYPLPLAQAEDVEFQSAFVSLEGSPELEVQPTTAHRTVDEAELYQARYLLEQPPTGDRRLIGAYGYSGRDGVIKIDVVRRQQHVLPSAIAQRAELTTYISANGLVQTFASYELVTKASILEVALPGDAVLWTMLVDGQPTKPQKEKGALLVSLPPRDDLAVRRVEIVFETTGVELSLAPTVKAAAPKLLLRGGGDEPDREVPQADLEWKLILPQGYQLKSSSGTVAPIGRQQPDIIALRVWRMIEELGGGIRRRPFYGNQIGGVAGHNWRTYDSMKEVPLSANMSKSEAATEGAPQAGEKFDSFQLDAPAKQPAAGPEPAPAPPQEVPPPVAMPADPQAPAAADPFAAPPPPGTAPSAQNLTVPVPNPGRPLDGKEAIAAFANHEGMQSLRINANAADAANTALFRSLGVDPQLQVTLVDTTRILWGAVGVGLLVFLMGVALTHRPAKQQAAYVIIFLLAGSVPVLLTSALDELAPVFDGAFLAACALVPYFLIAAIVLSLWRAILRRLPADCCQPVTTTNVPLATNSGTIVTPLLLLALLFTTTNEIASQEPMPAAVKAIDLKDLLPLLDPGGPVTVPADAVIVPYDPEAPDGPAQAKKVLIPYAKFIELWNRAHPDKPKEAKPAPIDFAVLSAVYETTLSATDELVVTGKLTIDVLSDKPVAIPLPFSGGVLVKATLDGKPARLQVVAPQAATPNNPGPQQQVQQAANPAPNPPDGDSGGVIVLHTQGAGRKEAEVSFRLGLTRRGGWRQVSASLPLAGATGLTLTVPDAATEVRIASTFDRDNFETKAANEKIETTLAGGGGGRLDLQWRPKVAVGQIDQSLTAKSIGVLDVREDALRLTWIAELSFGRGTRDQFEFSLPLGYSIEQVVSENLRGWQVKPDAARQVVSVTLLKPATGSEKVTLVLSKRGRIGTGEFAAFDAPAVFVSGAALQQGEIMVRRSPRLELRTETAAGLVRADSDNRLATAVQAADAEDPSILNLRPYQVYRFVTSGATDKFQLRLNAAEAAAATSAEVRAILRIAERETTLEANLKFIPQGQPLYHVDVLLPAGFEIDQLLPADVSWSVVNDAASGRKKLSVQLLDGREHEFTLTLLGHFAKREKWEEVAAPVVSILGVDRQQGEIVVLSDPDTDVQGTNLKNAETGILQQSHGWLKAEQQPLARVTFKYRAADYAATFKLTRKTPRVTVRTVSNVKVTRRAIEETVLLEYQIADAGIHELKFLLPDSLRTARIRIPQEESLLQRKKIEPATANGQLLPGWILVTLSLQDDVTDRLGVIVEHDRLLTDKPQEVAPPRSLTGTTSQRLVVIENAGRDEVVEVKRVGLEPISRQQQAWQEMLRLLGTGVSENNVTQAYVAVGEQAPNLTFKTQQNQQVQTAQARIEFARTTLIVDDAGGYRALVNFQMSNSTEQYLDIVLPAGAKLWTAIVKGQPVKPVEHSPPKAGEVRIPLIKTPAGSGDYTVSIRYGGNLGKLSSLKPVHFPLIRTQRINVEHSQVQLFLPEDFHWPAFGGTMSQVKSEAELEEGFQSYFQKKVAEAKQALQSDDLNTQLRAQANLSGLLQTWQFNSASRSANNLKQSGLALHNYQELQEAQGEAEAQVQMNLVDPQTSDNRKGLNDAWMAQKVARSKNVVTQLGNNFDQPSSTPETAQPGEPGKKSELAYNPQFLKGNKLNTEEANEKTIQEELKKVQEQQKEDTRSGTRGPQRTPAPDGKPSGEGQPQQPSQGRISRGGKVQQLAKDLEGDRAGLNRELNNFESNQPAGGYGGRQGGGQSATRGMGLGKGRGAGDRPEEETTQNQGQPQVYGEQNRQRDNAFRYQQKLAQDQQQQLAQQLPNQALPLLDGTQSMQGQPGGAPEFPKATLRSGAGGVDLDFRFNNQNFNAQTPQMGGFAAPHATGGAALAPATPLAPTGLASLDIDVPARGQVFLFTMPRGEIEITARPYSWDLIMRWINLGIIALVIAVGIALYRIGRTVEVRRVTGTMAFAILMIVIGFGSVLFGFLPTFGGVLMLVGVVLVVRRILDQRRAAPAPATTTTA